MRPLAIFALVLCGLVLSFGAYAEAAPVPPCVFGGPEELSLMPAGGVTHNGLIVQRRASDGLYRTDAGHVFGVERGTVSAPAVQVQSFECSVPATQVTVTALEPFAAPDAGPRTFGLEVQP